MEYRALWRSKKDQLPEECDDAWAANSMRGRFAVADGATGSAYAGSWAKHLVQHFKEHAEAVEDWLDLLPDLQAGWMSRFEGRELPWYSEHKLQLGAFATFLGLVFQDVSSRTLRWEAIAVGDSCLFHTRGKELLAVFPVNDAQQFNNSPHLLGSRSAVSEIRAHRLSKAQGELKADDRLWLMTDALAQWCLAEHAASRDPWEPLESLREAEFAEDDFAVWIDELRDNQQIHDDDVTLMAIWR